MDTFNAYFLPCNFIDSTKYSDKDNGGMLVWSPHHTIVDSKCKYLQLYIFFVTSFFMVTTSCIFVYVCVLFFFFSVDEYIAIAKEKHGYNVEQVSHENTVLKYVVVVNVN